MPRGRCIKICIGVCAQVLPFDILCCVRAFFDLPNVKVLIVFRVSISPQMTVEHAMKYELIAGLLKRAGRDY